MKPIFLLIGVIMRPIFLVIGVILSGIFDGASVYGVPFPSPYAAHAVDGWDLSLPVSEMEGYYEQTVLKKISSVNDLPILEFSWRGRAGYIYFVETSVDLKNWNLIGAAYYGTGQPLSYRFTTNAQRLFIRLVLTKRPTDNLWRDDLDGDGICNGDELVAGMDPFVPEPFVDSDNDGLSDAWEMRYFGSLVPTGEGSFLNDGISNKDKYQNGINPTRDENQYSDLKVEYKYNGTGQLTQVSSSAFTVSCALDAENNLINVQ